MLLCWKICKKGEELDGHEPAIHIHMLVACTRVQKNNIIMLINTDTARILYRRTPKISKGVLL